MVLENNWRRNHDSLKLCAPATRRARTCNPTCTHVLRLTLSKWPAVPLCLLRHRPPLWVGRRPFVRLKHTTPAVPPPSVASVQPSMSVSNKILRSANAPTSAPSEIETSVAQALLDLESNVSELTAELRPLQISSVKEVDVKGGKKAIVVFVPMPQLKAYHKIQVRLTRELEKKFSDRHVVFVGQRRILRKPARGEGTKQPRPRSRTLTAVHEAILEDLAYPSDIVGRRTRFAVDGSKLIKTFLDAKDITALEYKTETFSAVYKQLTGKDVVFSFAESI